jgi:hypothetical protein
MSHNAQCRSWNSGVTSLEEFKIPSPNGAFFPAKSINNVLYIWESTSLVSNAVTTRSASKKQKLMMMSKMSIQWTLKHFTRTLSQSEKQSWLIFNFYERESSSSSWFFTSFNYVSWSYQTALLFPKPALAPSLWSCLNYARFTSSRTSNRLTIRSLCHVFNQNKPANVPPIYKRSLSQTRTNPLRHLQTVPNINVETTSHLPWRLVTLVLDRYNRRQVLRYSQSLLN